jgi:hypothetical protein
MEMEDDKIGDTFAIIRTAVAPWLPSAKGRPAGPAELAQALRAAAQAAPTAYAHDLWERAAANADAAAWIDAQGETGRELWAAVADYTVRAAAEAPTQAP